MELCERYLSYMSALCEGTLPAPEALHLSGETPVERAAQLQKALQTLSVPDFVRLCAASAGDKLDEAIFKDFSEEAFSRALLEKMSGAEEAEPPQQADAPPAPDPDAGKHAFEVFCDCVALDEQLVAYLIDILHKINPNSIHLCTLLDKPERREADITADYSGFPVPNEFVVGYGLDYAQKYRNLPFIGVLKREVYTK